MTWSQRLNQVLKLDIETCSECGSAFKVIICIEDPVVIEKILTHLNERSLTIEAPRCRKAGYCRKRAYTTEAKKSNYSTQVAATQPQAAGHQLA
jgi:hypothetical protein